MIPRTDRLMTLSGELVTFAAACQEGEIEGLQLSAQECRQLAERFKAMAVTAAWLEAHETRTDGLDFAAPTPEPVLERGRHQAHAFAAPKPDPKIAIFPGVRRERPNLVLVDAGGERR